MKRRFFVILIAQTVLVVLFIIYALVQKSEADIQRLERLRLEDRNDELLKLLKEKNERDSNGVESHGR